MKRAPVFWFTGLSGAGKSTVAGGARDILVAEGWQVLILDGDDIRAKLHRDLGFSREDVRTNNTLIADLCDERRSRYDAILVPVISPYADIRAQVRKSLSPGFFEIFCDTGLEIVRARDTKGLYQREAKGQIADLIGVSASTPYEAPKTPDLRLPTGSGAPGKAVDLLLQFIRTQLSMAA